MAGAFISFFMLSSLSVMASTDQHGANLFPAVSRGTTGYIGQEGNLAIPCLFEDGKKFSQGLAAVLVDGKWGYVNERGEIAIKPFYQEAGDFSDDMAWVRIEGKCGYIDRQGTVVIEPQYKRAASFSEGFAVVDLSRCETLLLDKTGKVAISPNLYCMQYRPTPTLSGFSEGLLFAYVSETCSPVYLDRDGEIAVHVPVEAREGYTVRGTAFSEGLAAVQIKGKWGYIDKTGRVAIAPEYHRAAPFRHGLACVEVVEIRDQVGRTSYFIIDTKGTKVKQIPWRTSGEFSEGLLPVGMVDEEKSKRVYGYMDTRGEMVIPPQFDDALPFEKGLAPVRIDERDAYVDTQGRTVWTGEPKGDEPVTSYSGRSMLDMYAQMLTEENWPLALFYIQKMNRKELVEGSRKTLAWLLEDPKRTESRDLGRRGTIGMVAVAPFLEMYSRSFTAEGNLIDPSPFRSMLLDKSLDRDFRRELANCYGDRDFYETNWRQLAEDAEVLSKLVRDVTEEEEIRRKAAESIFRIVFRIYGEYRHETIGDDAATGDEKGQKPDIVGMLDETPCPFATEQKAHWELLVNSTEKAAKAALKLWEEAQSEKTRLSVYRCLKGLEDCHLVRDKHLLKRIGELRAARERANTDGG